MVRKLLSTAVIAATLSQAGITSAAHHEMGGHDYTAGEAKTVQDWWPNVVNLRPLRENEMSSSPLGEEREQYKKFFAAQMKPIKTAVFIKSSADVQECPKPDRPEYAFIGRSNVGKSSLINALTNLGQIRFSPDHVINL